MMLDKAQFEAEAELHNRKNKPDDIQTSED
jgi:hypothetical protein